jgi:hypothetical protein
VDLAHETIFRFGVEFVHIEFAFRSDAGLSAMKILFNNFNFLRRGDRSLAGYAQIFQRRKNWRVCGHARLWVCG